MMQIKSSWHEQTEDARIAIDMSVQTGDTAMSPLIKSFVAGSLSGTCSTLILQPLDLVKTRLQRDKTLHGGRSQGVLNIYRNVVKNEGVFALWKGLTPALLRCVPGLGLYFCTLTALQSNLSSPTPTSLQILTIGATARSLSVITLLPFTVIKTRLESGVYKYSGVVNALMTIYKTEGPRGLYSGILATLVRDVPFSSLYLLLYTRAKKLVSAERYEGLVKLSLCLASGVAAGTSASILTQPADVVKTYMQTERKPVVSSILHIYRVSGLTGFVSGILPRILRRTAMAAVTWACYEYISTVM